MELSNLDDLKNNSDNSIKQNEQLVSTLQCFSTDQYQIDFQQALENINQINIARSLPIYQQQLSMNFPQDQFLRSNTMDNFQFKQCLSPKKIKNKSPKKSNIFSRKTSIGLNLESTIRIYYFGLPLSKQIKFQKKTTTKDLIKGALHSYSIDPHFDQSKIILNDPDYYQLRVSQQQVNWIPQQDVDPIKQNRFISQSLLQKLVLTHKKDYNSLEKIKSGFESNLSLNENKVTITLYNQVKAQVCKVQLFRNDDLSSIFDLVQKNGFLTYNYYLCQNLEEDFKLTKDFQVKNLSFPKIYIKSIIYEDQQQDQKPKPFNVIENIPVKVLNNVIPPIGITEASMYQEFEIIKINSYGIQQQRILGIDQLKIYNYQKSVRKQHKSVSFFDKLRGINEQTGTKKPSRPITDLKSVLSQGDKIILEYNDKKVIYIQKDQTVRNKISRKLNFLLTYHNKC